MDLTSNHGWCCARFCQDVIKFLEKEEDGRYTEQVNVYIRHLKARIKDLYKSRTGYPYE